MYGDADATCDTKIKRELAKETQERLVSLLVVSTGVGGTVLLSRAHVMTTSSAWRIPTSNQI